MYTLTATGLRNTPDNEATPSCVYVNKNIMQ